jgi:polyisoprenoid-binding protein YceI
MRLRFLLASLLLATGFAHAEPVTYKLDPNHTNVLAEWSHRGYSRTVAHFGQVDGTLVYDADDVGKSSVQVTLPLSGLETFVPDFNEHLRSDDFFDAAKFPTATFRSTKVEQAGGNKLKVTGDLTLRGTTHPVVLDVTLNKIGESREGSPMIGFDATASLQRSAFGLGKYVPNVGDQVTLRISTEALGPKAAAAKATQ